MSWEAGRHGPGYWSVTGHPEVCIADLVAQRGRHIVMWFVAANRDARVFRDPSACAEIATAHGSPRRSSYMRGLTELRLTTT